MGGWACGRACGRVPVASVAGRGPVPGWWGVPLMSPFPSSTFLCRPLFPLQVLAKEGVTRYDPLGDAFDPNIHNALFQVPDATKEPGTIAVVVKVGALYSCGWHGIAAGLVGCLPAWRVALGQLGGLLCYASCQPLQPVSSHWRACRHREEPAWPLLMVTAVICQPWAVGQAHHCCIPCPPNRIRPPTLPPPLPAAHCAAACSLALLPSEGLHAAREGS